MEAMSPTAKCFVAYYLIEFIDTYAFFYFSTKELPSILQQEPLNACCPDYRGGFKSQIGICGNRASS
jgi:hypothetical protein